MAQDRDVRKQLIADIEGLRDSHVIVYFTGDRNPLNLQIVEDAIRPLYEHLLKLPRGTGRKKKIDLFLYSRGGDVSVPWRIISMFREFCEELHVLIPYKAYSAATMISMGADKIVMGRKAELGPIDPTTRRDPAMGGPPEISVEDVLAFVRFLNEKGAIDQQPEMATLLSLLANNLSPLALGNTYRTYSHIRLVAKKLLESRREKLSGQNVQAIIDTLTEKTYFHGHAIGRKEAAELGLPVEPASEGLDELLWNLYLQYEELLELTDTIDVEEVLTTKNTEDYTLNDVKQGVIESSSHCDLYAVTVEIHRQRQLPTVLNFTPQFQLPPNVQLLPQDQLLLQQVLQQMLQQMLQQFQQQVVLQAPVTGISLRAYGGKWRRFDEGAPSPQP